jgi:Cu-processing system permease protein
MPSINIFCRIAILQGLRSRMSWLVLALAILLSISSALAGAFSARQPLIVAMDVGFSFLHFALLFLTLSWVQELIQKDQDRKTLLWALAYPIPRSSYLLGKTFGVAILLGIAALLLSIPLWLGGHFAHWGYSGSVQPHFSLWFFSNIFAAWLESVTILAFTLLIFTVATTPLLPIAIGLLFAIACKTMGSALDFLLYSDDASEAIKQHILPTLKMIRWCLPDLSTLDWRTAVLYNDHTHILPTPAIAMALGYICLFLTLAVSRFSKRALG